MFLDEDVSPVISKKSSMGTALGPDWAEGLKMQGNAKVGVQFWCHTQSILYLKRYTNINFT